MIPDDILKAAPAIAKGAGALAAAIPLTPIIKANLGDAADELGQRFGDRVRLYRWRHADLTSAFSGSIAGSTSRKKPLQSIGLVAGPLVAVVYWAAVIVSPMV